MGNSYFKDHYWVKKNRLRLIAERGPVCQGCGRDMCSDLHLLQQHHRDRNKNNHADSNILLLCPACHGKTSVGITKTHKEGFAAKTKKTSPFAKTLVKKRAILLSAGFSLATINSWLYTARRPRYETAERLSLILGLQISQIPYRRTECNNPDPLQP